MVVITKNSMAIKNKIYLKIMLEALTTPIATPIGLGVVKPIILRC
jgi:hypothetical protein